MNNQRPNPKRYIGKLKQQNFQKSDGSGSFLKFTVHVDNPKPTNDDGSPNQFHKGALIWFDAETGKKYQVKQMELAGVSQNDSQKGYINSIRIDLDNEYHVDNLG